jgi:flagellar M-ring protein FliF
MALLNLETLRTQFGNFAGLSAFRQLGLMVGLAASVALGVAIVLWSQQPTYGLLYGGLSDKDSAQVMNALQAAGIEYKVDPHNGNIMVPADKVYMARIKLSTEGLPKGTASGLDMLNKNAGPFGTSQFMETVRYHRAIEQELERTIASLDSVQDDKVHLALPKQSVFIQDSPKPSASVLVNLYAGRKLNAAQVAGIVHMVASSVPGLQTDKVTVVDQQGNLLTGNQGGGDAMAGSAMSSAQYALTRRLDESYAKRITHILSPLVGASGVRAQVTTDLDYSLINTTSEKYDPNSSVVRSEQTSDDSRWDGSKNGGVPGSLTNQPPAAGKPAKQSASGSQNTATGQNATSTQNNGKMLESRKQATRNYEIDKTIQHIKQAPGIIKRLSVAVVVDYKSTVGKDGKTQQVPLSSQEMANITNLVKEAVGFDATRGDKVNVINAPFMVDARPQTAAAPAGPSFWAQPWFWDISKQVLGGLAVLFLMFGVLRPVLRSLSTASTAGAGQGAPALTQGGVAPAVLGVDTVSLSGQPQPALTDGSGYDQQLTAARTLAESDPKRVAQVVKTWLAKDE